jgi:LMBR1-like membrane protein
MFYVMCGIVGLIVILYAIFGVHISPSQLIDLIPSLTNAYGLALLTILMGYGLVEVPRGLWFNADTQWILRYIESTVPALKESTVDTEAEVYEVARVLSTYSACVGGST